MDLFDVVIVGYAVNQRSGGYSDNRFTFLETIGARYLYRNCFLDTYCAEPMAFMQLSAELRAAGWVVDVIDGLILGYDKSKLIEKLDNIDSSIFCFSIYESTKQDIYEIIHQLKMKKSGINTVLGGPYATIAANEIMDENADIDYIIVGDADIALPKLVSKISAKQDVFSVPNLFHRHNGKIMINDTMCVDLNKLEYPDRL
ncbi:MAG: cobalamin-dependent protein, partial [Nitrososphaerota archaeon]|nr:cobalamin-dependent protein [Nitrososphaerota archaeon]